MQAAQQQQRSSRPSRGIVDPSRQKIYDGINMLNHYRRQMEGSRDLKVNPRNISIEGQKQGEIIFLYIRRNWTALVDFW